MIDSTNARILRFTGIALAAIVLATTRAHGQGTVPVIAHPNVTPVSVSRALTGRAPGLRHVFFTGFGADIASRDWLTNTVRAQNGRVAASRVPSPWLDVGIKATNERVARYVQALARAGAVIDSFSVETPAAIAGTRLADITLPSWKLMAADPRAPVLAAELGIRSLSLLGTDRASIETWRSAAPARSDAIMVAAVDSAVLAAYPNAKGPLRRPYPPAPTPTVQAPHSMVSAKGAAPPIASAQAQLSPAPPVSQAQPSAAASPEAASRTAAMIAVPANPAAISVLADPARGRRTSDWTGQLRYEGARWPTVFSASMSSPELRQLLFALDGSARSTMAAPDSMFRRPNSLAEIDPAILDPRASSVGANREAFALALADCSQADFVRTKGVELAIMAVYGNNPGYTQRCNQILAEMAGHRPLQRPGWTLTSAGMAMPNGGDGVWLATNWGICGIVDMLTILGDRVAPQTRAALRTLLREEVNRIAQDWAEKRPWYVRGRAVTSNQWIEPNVGLVKACLYLGDQDLLPAYNLGVENLAMTLEALGADGAFLEGLGYATMTLGPLFDVLADLRANGDRRCHGFPFTDNAWKWILQMHMPGRQVVNSYDCRMSQLPDWALRSPMPSWVSAALATDDPAALPTMKWFYPSGTPSVAGIRYQVAVQSSRAECTLPEQAWFPSQQQLVWRSEWQAPASPGQSSLAMWLRGGSTRESHTHRDQGHVSIYCGNRIVLMDCGTPDYSTPDFNLRYAEAPGHNVMQVGELKPRGTAVSAPVTIRSLGREGGAVSIDTKAAYVGVQLCTRDVTWTSVGRFTIEDHVSLSRPAAGGTEFYRFHTGSTDALEINGSGHDWTIRWRGTAMRATADRPIWIDQAEWPDATKAPFKHRVVVVRAAEAGQGLSLETVIDVDPSVTE